MRHLAVPDRVPGRVPLRLAVAENEIDLAAARGQVELEAGSLVVVAVETHADHVDGDLRSRRGARVTMDVRRVVVGTNRDVDVSVVVEDLELGGLRRRCALGRHLLRVVARPTRPASSLVVEPAVDRRRLALEAARLVDARRVLAAERVRGGRRAGRRFLGEGPSRDGAGPRHEGGAAPRRGRRSERSDDPRRLPVPLRAVNEASVSGLIRASRNRR